MLIIGMNKILALTLLFTFVITSSTMVFSQVSSSGVGVSIEIADSNAPHGSIVAFKDGTYSLSSEEYDKDMFGVINENPPLLLEFPETGSAIPVVSEGEVEVRVTNVNGDIKKGDFVTSSDTPGVGQKADRSGYVLGIATENHAGGEGLIAVQADIKLATMDSINENLVEGLSTALRAPFLTPLTSMRYLIAALVATGAFVVGFSSFGRISGRGIEALGRNPLARRSIQIGIVFNFILTAVIMLLGLLLAYFILTL